MTTDSRTPPTQAAVVIGSGPAGLVSAAELLRRQVPTLVLERSERLGAAWAGRYDSLRFNTGRRSTDMGNVSAWVPAIHPTIAAAQVGMPSHFAQMAAQSITDAGDAAIRDAARQPLTALPGRQCSASRYR